MSIHAERIRDAHEKVKAAATLRERATALAELQRIVDQVKCETATKAGRT